jgi:DNA (cytosine-5)-methyltransferase 1
MAVGLPRLLDLFCGAGGATRGYQQAGFCVTGVDHHPHPRYVGEAFVQADALEYLTAHGQEYDVIHASPPCQAYSALKHLVRAEHPQVIKVTRLALQATAVPYVIENVVGAPLDTTLLLCGSMFGLETPSGAQLRRHRLFESSVLLMAPGPCQHGNRPVAVHGDALRNEATRGEEGRVRSIQSDKARDGRTIMVVGATPRDPAAARKQYPTITVTGSTPQQNRERNHIRETFSIHDARIAMGIDWMTMAELSQAIPPAYTHWIGRQLLRHLTAFHQALPQ